jgi:hypothetical protein
MERISPKEIQEFGMPSSDAQSAEIARENS